MKIKKTLAFMTAAAIGISSFAAFASSAAAESDYGNGQIIDGVLKFTFGADSGGHHNIAEQHTGLDGIDNFGWNGSNAVLTLPSIDSIIGNNADDYDKIALRYAVDKGASCVLKIGDSTITKSFSIPGSGWNDTYCAIVDLNNNYKSSDKSKNITLNFTMTDGCNKTYVGNFFDVCFYNSSSFSSENNFKISAYGKRTQANPDTVYNASDIFVKTSTNANDETSGIQLDNNISNYTNAGSPFGDASNITDYVNCAINSCGTAVLEFDHLTAGTYKLNMIVNEFNNRYCDIYLDNILESDGSTVSGVPTFGVQKGDSNRKIGIQTVELKISESGKHIITIDTDYINNDSIMGLYAVTLTSPGKTEFAGETIQNSKGSGTLTSYGSSYQRFNDNKDENPVDVYLTSINPNNTTASGLTWYITGTGFDETVSTNTPSISGSSDIYFGLVITGTTEQLDSIKSVTLK